MQRKERWYSAGDPAQAIRLARGEQRCKVLLAPQGEEEGEDDDQALSISSAHHARGAGLTISRSGNVLFLYSANICAKLCDILVFVIFLSNEL